MRLVFLESALEDLEWMRYYYEKVFFQGRINAQKQFKQVQSLILDNPNIGHTTHKKGVREFSIPRTPFSYIYRIKPNQIEILRVWDERRDREEFE